MRLGADRGWGGQRHSYDQRRWYLLPRCANAWERTRGARGFNEARSRGSNHQPRVDWQNQQSVLLQVHELLSSEWGRNAADSDPLALLEVQKQIAAVEEHLLRSTLAQQEALTQLEWRKAAAEMSAARSHAALQYQLQQSAAYTDHLLAVACIGTDAAAEAAAGALPLLPAHPSDSPLLRNDALPAAWHGSHPDTWQGDCGGVWTQPPCQPPLYLSAVAYNSA